MIMAQLFNSWKNCLTKTITLRSKVIEIVKVLIAALNIFIRKRKWIITIRLSFRWELIYVTHNNLSRLITVFTTKDKLKTSYLVLVPSIGWFIFFNIRTKSIRSRAFVTKFKRYNFNVVSLTIFAFSN